MLPPEDELLCDPSAGWLCRCEGRSVGNGMCVCSSSHAVAERGLYEAFLYYLRGVLISLPEPPSFT